MNMHVSNIELGNTQVCRLPIPEGSRSYRIKWLKDYPEEAEAFAAMPAGELSCIYDLLTMCCDAALHMCNQPRVGGSIFAEEWIGKNIDDRLGGIREALVASLHFRDIDTRDDFEGCWDIALRHAALCGYEIDEVLRLAVDFKQVEPRKQPVAGTSAG